MSPNKYEPTIMVILKHFNDLDWQHHKLQTIFMVRLLDSIKKSPYISTIEGSLIDIFLRLLINPDDTPLTPHRSSLTNQTLFNQLSRTHSGQPVVDIKLQASGTTYIVNYLKMLMESTRLNTSTFFSTEVGNSHQRIVVSLVRRLCNKAEISAEQADLVMNTLVVILERLIESSPQIIPYFLESYLREFQLRLEESNFSISLFSELQKKFSFTLSKKPVFTSRNSMTKPILQSPRP
jgi:hypothetical protein